ncbi:hypothetical protein [Actinomadura bangladeshensis]|uniref:Uncharacterized protein n=1 Tax=Actinomadura bangladeshensis TaxID=453573 RepID=A0A4R4P8B0_9ACTN|nr:hypothetical protein [Actinomadura bangladeshensis]TDC17133.1 hypothetical protein E1284_10315 [Actinomadura bangladeshensis]
MDELVRELKRLRGGRGVHAEDLSRRVGPQLRALAGAAERAGTAELRRRLAAELTAIADGLPDDLRLAFLAALALHPDARHRLAEDRMDWLAARLDRGVRTARRRADEAIRAVAERAAARTGASAPLDGAGGVPDGWHLAALRSIVRLDGPAVSVTEERDVVAETGGLDRIALSTGVPPGSGHAREDVRFEAEVLAGGTLELAERLTPTYFRHVVRLPRPLERRERHRVTVSYTFPPGRRIHPRYMFQSTRLCAQFELQLRFGAAHRAGKVWRIDGLPRGMVDDFTDPAALVPLDHFGEVRFDFTGLRTGLAYGARWEE